MTQDWAAEWEQEQQEVDDLIRMLTQARDCDHEWIDSGLVEGALSWVEFVCEKCGTSQGFKDEVGEPLLPDTLEGKGRHCL